MIEWFYTRSPLFRRYASKTWYRFISGLATDTDIFCINYGYEDGLTQNLNHSDKVNRFCLNLYHKVIAQTDLTDKKVLEVASGLGGGSLYMASFYSPLSVLGIDITKKFIYFAKKSTSVTI